jgi:arsenite-transporting ATPase
MVSTTEGSKAAQSQTKARMQRLTDRLKDPERSVFIFVAYPESTPVVEAYRAFRDLHAAGIDAQAVVANQVLPPEFCTNDYFRRRRAMQEEYLEQIRRRFGLPVVVLPLFGAEIRGMTMVAQAGSALMAPEAAPVG